MSRGGGAVLDTVVRLCDHPGILQGKPEEVKGETVGRAGGRGEEEGDDMAHVSAGNGELWPAAISRTGGARSTKREIAFSRIRLNIFSTMTQERATVDARGRF